jgi:hypothetical protein
MRSGLRNPRLRPNQAGDDRKGPAMKLKPIVLGAFLASALALSLSAVAAPNGAKLLIHHQQRGCHAWSLNGGPFIVQQSLRLARGGSLTVTNDDLMVQELVKTHGPAVNTQLVKMGSMNMGAKMHMGMAGPYAMAHMGATVKVTFPRVGTYRFRLMDRGDYYTGIKTVGPDNKPTLSVVVS